MVAPQPVTRVDRLAPPVGRRHGSGANPAKGVVTCSLSLAAQTPHAPDAVATYPLAVGFHAVVGVLIGAMHDNEQRLVDDP